MQLFLVRPRCYNGETDTFIALPPHAVDSAWGCRYDGYEMMTGQHLVGVEIGGTKLQAVRGRTGGAVDEVVREVADHQGGAVAIVDQVKGMIEKLIGDGQVSAIGIGFGGPVDEKSGHVIKSHQVDGWEDWPLSEWMENAFGAPCRLGNDSNTATLAEATVGAGRGKSSTFYTNLGSGIGGGLVKDGRLYTGRHGAMEIGHIWSYSTLLRRWDRLELLCSGWSIGQRARDMVEADRSTLLVKLCQGHIERLDASGVAKAWQADDPTATRLMDDVIDSFSRAICNVVALLNPQIIVVGGGVAQMGDPFFGALRKAVHSRVFAPFAENFMIKPAELGEMAVPVGALLLAEQVLQPGGESS